MPNSPECPLFVDQETKDSFLALQAICIALGLTEVHYRYKLPLNRQMAPWIAGNQARVARKHLRKFTDPSISWYLHRIKTQLHSISKQNSK